MCGFFISVAPDASGGAFVCAGGAVRFAAQRPPLRGLVLASSIFFVPPQAAELIHFAARPLQIATAALGCNLVPAPLAGKDMEEKGAGDAK